MSVTTNLILVTINTTPPPCNNKTLWPSLHSSSAVPSSPLIEIDVVRPKSIVLLLKGFIVTGTFGFWGVCGGALRNHFLGHKVALFGPFGPTICPPIFVHFVLSIFVVHFWLAEKLLFDC